VILAGRYVPARAHQSFTILGEGEAPRRAGVLRGFSVRQTPHPPRNTPGESAERPGATDPSRSERRWDAVSWPRPAGRVTRENRSCRSRGAIAVSAGRSSCAKLAQHARFRRNATLCPIHARSLLDGQATSRQVSKKSDNPAPGTSAVDPRLIPDGRTTACAARPAGNAD
jgi:hypothetical protein